MIPINYSTLQRNPSRLLKPIRSQEGLENNDIPLKRSQPRAKLLRNLCLIVTELLIEVGAVGAGLHGDTKDFFDDEAVVLLERALVRRRERIGKFLIRVDVLAQREGGEVEAAGYDRLARLTWGVRGGGAYRTSHIRPSEATLAFWASSVLTRSWRVSDVTEWASWRSRIFCDGGVKSWECGGARGWCTLMFPVMSDWTTLKAAFPRTSARGNQHLLGQLAGSEVPKSSTTDSAASRNSVVEILLSTEMGTVVKFRLAVSKKVGMAMEWV